MNNLTGLSVAVLYNSLLYNESAGAAGVKEACADCTILDLAGLDEAAIDTAIATLSATSYDKVYCLAQPADTHAASRPTYDQVAALRAKLKPASLTTAVEGGTSVVTHSDASHLELEATTTASTVNNYYNTCIVVSISGTGDNVPKLILGYVGATKVAAVGGAAWTDPDADTVYAIYNETNLIVPQATGLTDVGALQVLSSGEQAKTTSQRVWEGIHPGNTLPLILQYISPVASSFAYGTSDTSGSTTTDLADAAVSFGTDDHLIGHYAYFLSGSGGEGVYAKIASHTDTVLTLSSFQRYPLGAVTTAMVDPSNDTVYRIANNIDKIFWEPACIYAIGSILFDVTDAAMWKKWQALLNNADNKSNLDNLEAGKGPETDFILLTEEIIPAGLAICAGLYNDIIS